MKVVVPVLVLLICICQLSGSIKRLASFAVKSREFKWRVPDEVELAAATDCITDPTAVLTHLIGSPKMIVCANKVPAGTAAAGFMTVTFEHHLGGAPVPTVPPYLLASVTCNVNAAETNIHQTTCYLVSPPRVVGNRDDGYIVVTDTASGNLLAHFALPKATPLQGQVISPGSTVTISYDIEKLPMSATFAIGKTCTVTCSDIAVGKLPFQADITLPVRPLCAMGWEPIWLQSLGYAGGDITPFPRRDFSLGLVGPSGVVLNTVPCNPKTPSVDPGSRIYEFCMVDELPVEYFSAVELTVGVISQPCYLRGAPVPKAEFTQYTCVLDGPSLPAGNVALTAFKFVNGVDEFQQVTDTTAGPKVIATVVAAGGTLSPDPCVLSVITANSDIGIATDQIEIKGTCLATARFSVTFNEYVVGPDRTAENKGVPPVHLTRQQRINNAVATAVVKVLRKDSSAIVYLPALQEPLYRNDALIVTVASPSVGGPSFPITFTVVAQPNKPAGDSLRCLRKGDNGDNNSWWMTYRAKKAGYWWADDLHLATGLEGSATSELWESPVYYTLAQIFPLSNDKHISHIIYNEQFKDPKSKSINGYAYDSKHSGNICGHMKGAMAWNSEGKGFWITHSLPNFPMPNITNYPKDPAESGIHAQHFLCVPLDGWDDVNRVHDALHNAVACVGKEKMFLRNYNAPPLGTAAFAKVGELMHRAPVKPSAAVFTVKPSRAAGLDFFTVSKGNIAYRDAWDDILRAAHDNRPFDKGTPFEVTAAPFGNLQVFTHRAQNWFPSCCGSINCVTKGPGVQHRKPFTMVSTPHFQFVTTQIGAYKFPAPLVIGADHDHSKWGINGARFYSKASVWPDPRPAGAALPDVRNTDPYVCFSDINRQLSQRERGGTTTCFKHELLWRAMALQVNNEVEYCSSNQNKAVPVSTTKPSDTGPNPINALRDSISYPPGFLDWQVLTAKAKRDVPEDNEPFFCDVSNDESPFPCQSARVLLTAGDVDIPRNNLVLELHMTIGETSILHVNGKMVANVYYTEDNKIFSEIFWDPFLYTDVTGVLVVSPFTPGPGQADVDQGGLLVLHNSPSLHQFFIDYYQDDFASEACQADILIRDLRSRIEVQEVSEMVDSHEIQIDAMWVPDDLSLAMSQDLALLPSFNEMEQRVRNPRSFLGMAQAVQTPGQAFISVPKTKPIPEFVVELTNFVSERFPGQLAQIELASNSLIALKDGQIPELQQHLLFIATQNPFMLFYLTGDNFVVCSLPPPDQHLLTDSYIAVCSHLRSGVHRDAIQFWKASRQRIGKKRAPDQVTNVSPDLSFPFAKKHKLVNPLPAELPIPEGMDVTAASKRFTTDSVVCQPDKLCSACTEDIGVFPVLPPKCLTGNYLFSTSDSIFLYKLPRQTQSPNELMRSGTAYLYSVRGGVLKSGEYSLSQDQNPLSETMFQFELPLASRLTIVAYKSSNESFGGLGNGFLAVAGSTGIWVTHSYAPVSTTFPSSVADIDQHLDEGHTWTCTPIIVEELENITSLLSAANVDVYYSQLQNGIQNEFPSLRRFLDPASHSSPKAVAAAQIQLLSEENRLQTMAFASSPQALFPLIQLVVAPVLDTGSLLVRSRSRDAPSTCSGDDCDNYGSITHASGTFSFAEFRPGQTISWPSTADSSTWAVSCSGDWVCVVDSETSSASWPKPAISYFAQGSFVMCSQASGLAASLRSIGGACIET